MSQELSMLFICDFLSLFTFLRPFIKVVVGLGTKVRYYLEFTYLIQPNAYKLMCFDRNINGNSDVKFLECD